MYTDTWVIPSKDERICTEKEVGNLKINDGCKIKNTLGERFWVILIEKASNGLYIGKVNNELILPSPYNFGDKVSFYPSDVWDVMTDTRRDIDKIKIIDKIMAFYVEYGRRPTYDEMIQMNTHIYIRPT